MRVFNDVGEVSALAYVTNDIIRGVVAIYHGFWRRHIGGNTVNALVSSSPSRIGRGITVMTQKYGLNPLAHPTKIPQCYKAESISQSFEIAFPNTSILNFNIGVLDVNNQHFKFKQSIR